MKLTKIQDPDKFWTTEEPSTVQHKQDTSIEIFINSWTDWKNRFYPTYATSLRSGN